MENTYYELWKKKIGDATDHIHELSRLVRFIRHDQLRFEMLSKYSWAIPNDEALDTIVKYSPIIEIGAGLGYWAALLAARGAEVVAFDQHAKLRWNADAPRFYPIKVGGPPKVALYPKHTLFLCWPPWQRTMASRCLAAYRGNVFLYVGEGASGCVGDPAFHAMLEKDWIVSKAVRIPTWPFLHDRLNIYRRRKPIASKSTRPVLRKCRSSKK